MRRLTASVIFEDGFAPFTVILRAEPEESPREAPAGGAGNRAWRSPMFVAGYAVRRLRRRGFAGRCFGFASE